MNEGLDILDGNGENLDNLFEDRSQDFDGKVAEKYDISNRNLRM